MPLLKQVFWTMSFIGWSCLAFFLHADDKKGDFDKIPLIPRQILFGNPEKAAPSLSPNGKQLAYLAPDSQGVLNIWVKNLTDNTEAKQVTSDKYRGIRSFMWQYDQQNLLYAQDKNGDENWHLYQTNIETKETKELTPFEGVFVYVADYNPHYPNTILIGMNKRNPAVFDIYSMDLRTGKIELEVENPDDVFGWVVDNHLNVKMAKSYQKDGSTLIRVRDSKTSPWREWLTASPLESISIVGFSPSNTSVYAISDRGEAINTARLVEIDFASGKEHLITQDPEYDLEGVLINPLTYELEAAQVEREYDERIILDSKLQPDFDFLTKELKGSYQLVSRDLDNKQWVIALTSDVKPTSYYLYQREPKSLKFLFTTKPNLEKYTLSPMKPIHFHARDGMKLYGYLTLPVGKEPKNLPTVLLVHGGPWVRDSWGINPQVQWLANRGYAVLQINYRGSTGYGKQYTNAGNREWGGKMQTDLLDGKQWMIEKGYADPTKVAIYGGSYGGYATLFGLASTPNEFCCGVDVVGPSSIITLLETMPAYWGPLQAKSNLRIGNKETEKEFLKSRSPLYKADKINKPLFIAHGANDSRVKQSESDQIVKILRENKIPVEYIVFPDEGHGFARPENRLKYYAAAEDFLSKYLGGRKEASVQSDDWEKLKK